MSVPLNDIPAGSDPLINLTEADGSERGNETEVSTPSSKVVNFVPVDRVQ